MRWVLLILVTVGRLNAETLFAVPWGKEAGQLGYYNASTPPFDQPYGEGPGGIAVGPGGEIWIADQFNDRILRFDRAGKVLGAIGAIGEVKLARPRTLWTDPGKQVAVYNSTEMSVLWQDLVTKKLVKIERADGKNLSQVEAIAGTPAGELWVGDFMRSALFRFDRAGPPQRRPWGVAGLAVDGAGQVWSIEHRPVAGARGDFWLVSADATGASRDRFPLVAPDLESPYLVGLDAKGNAVVRFIRTASPKDAPKGRNPNRFVVMRFDAQGKGTLLGETQVSVVSQQFVVTPEGAVLGLSFDAMAAPQGAVEIVELR